MTHLAAREKGFRPLPTEHFTVPESWVGIHVLLIPAGPQWAKLDFAAVSASRPRIKHLFGPYDDWPPENLDLASNQSDLEWHAREFQKRQSFAYHLFDHDITKCLGCLYIYPTASRDHDAEAYLWTHIDLNAVWSELIEDEVIHWVTHHWPFPALAWPGRFIPFDEWREAQLPNYYACYRTP